MSDEEARPLVLLPQAQQLLVEALARDLVEGGEGLVEEQEPGAGGQGPGDGGAHAHAAGELGREGVGEVGEAHQLEELAHPSGVRGPAQLQGQSDVAVHRAPGQQGRVLEDEPQVHLAAPGPRPPAVDGELPARGFVEAGHQPQEGGLAAARGSDDGGEPPAPDIQIEAAQRLDAGGEALAQAAGDDPSLPRAPGRLQKA